MMISSARETDTPGRTQQRVTPKVLVVDSDKRQREILGHVLQESGHTCTLAADSLEARELLRGDHYDLVFYDISDTERPKLDFARTVLAECPHTGVVLIVKSDNSRLLSHVRDTGAIGYLTKPYVPEKVKQGVVDAFQRLRKGEPLPQVSGDLKEGVSYADKIGEKGSTPREIMGTQAADAQTHRMIIDNAQDIIFLADSRGYISFVNPYTQERLGYSRDELCGMHYLELIREDYRQAAERFYSAQLAEKTPSTYWEFPVVDKDMSEIWLGHSVQLIMDGEHVQGFQSISRDIGDRIHLDRERLKFLQAVEQSSSIVMITDTEGRIEYVNPKLTEITGYSREEFIQDHPGIFDKSETTSREQERLWRIVTSGETWRGQHKSRKKNGELYWESVSISPISNKDGTITHLLVIKEDITDAKRSEEKLENANRELEEINEQLEKAIGNANQLAFAAEAANASKSEFLANMSHEIRTPMNAIIGMTELALDTQLTTEQEEYLRIVKASADSLLNLINDIMDFSKIEVRKLDLDSIDFDLRDTLDDTLKTLAFRAHEKSLELVCHVLPEVPEALTGDPGRLRQIVVNLVGNAIKFTDQGEVVLRVSEEQQTTEETCLYFSITDTGVGIPKEKQAMIFEPFAQADGSTTRAHRGTGLGLAISSHLVEMMRGRLWVDSEPGVGSTFHFTVRMKLQNKAVSKRDPDDMVEVRDLPVLIVDDNSTNRRILQEMLTSWGMKPTAVEDGNAALKIMQECESVGEDYPLVIMDANMPEMDGFALAQEIRQEPKLNSSTIMMLTSAGLRGDAARCRELGVAAYLTKPIKQSYLLDAILTALQDRGSHERPPHLITRHTLRENRPAVSSASGPALRILLAEDNAVNQKLMLRLLEKRGHSVDVVNDGEEALEALEERRYDLVFMDLQMPRMDGLTATKNIRERARATGEYIPIIALTAHAMAGDRQRCLGAGMDGYVAKPIQPQKLFDAVEQAMQSGGGTSGCPDAEEVSASELPVIDKGSLLGRLDQDTDLLHEVVSVFLEDCPGMMDGIRHALKTGDSTSLRRSAHTLKGAVGNLGGLQAYETAREVEAISSEGDLTRAGELVAELEHAIHRFVEALEHIEDKEKT